MFTSVHDSLEQLSHLLAGTRCPGLKLFEEVVAFVVDEYEGREVFHLNFPDGFHSEFRIFYTFNALYGTL